MSREYTKLSQNERDLESTNYVFKPIEKKRSCCAITFIVCVMIVLISGGGIVLGGIFFKPQMDDIISTYWTRSDNRSDADGHMNNFSIVPNNTLENMTANIFSSTPLKSLPQNQNAEIQKEIIKTEKNNTVIETSKTHSEESGDEKNSEDGDNESEDEEEEDEPTTTTSKPLKHHGKKKSNNTQEHGLLYEVTGNDDIQDDPQEKFATMMIKFERLIENLTGIRRPELVVPLLMLLCFIVSLSLASCCCYLMMKKRETHRRRVLAKMITDLQTGDSKAVLLDQDGDD